MPDALVFDVDGTICFDGRTIDPSIVTAIARHASERPVIFASARPIRDLLPVLPPDFHNYPLIGGNGAFIRHNGTQTVAGLSDENRRSLDSIIDTFALDALVDGDWDYSFSGDPDHRIYRQLDPMRAARNIDRGQIPTYAKVILFTRDSAVHEAVRSIGLPFSVHEDEGTIDIAPSGISKYRALGTLGFDRKPYVAFGNDANDVTMLEHARVSYRVGEHPALAFAMHTLGRREVRQAIAAL
ncbi:HAD-IIB family hydrolase [Bifidobacterium psychraerophilum]|uniref:HAD-IIB family hydrolase n=1 Tax=Bifidobacterium psychraerophilum TaxID=218140 RepID=UPI0039E9A68B